LNRTIVTNDPKVVQSYKGIEFTLTKRFANRWQMLAGYTRSKNRLDDVSVDTSPNFLINANGNITNSANADRPNQFKFTGMYLMPWHDVILSGNFSAQQGPPFTRQISRAVGFATNQVINLEPLGSTRIDTLTKIDVRLGKQFKMANNRLFEASVDFDNLTNANTVWGVRNRTESTSFLDPTTNTRQTLTQFLSPSQILGPRTVVLRGQFRF
jgi:outer membrane receptor for ferric coprogen and ferric-rhodotorulic acid